MVVGDISTGVDVAVIGGGPAGYAAAIRAGQRDLDVALIERAEYGGTCLNHGCIPSKAMISATETAHQAATAERMGIEADPSVDLETMVGWKDRVVRRLTKGVESLCEASGVTLIEGTARFLDEDRIQISHEEDAGRGGETLGFEHAIIATGSRPVELPMFSHEDEGILTSRDALALDTMPESMLVVGAGYIGLELATVFAKLGTDVTVVEMLERGLVQFDADLVEPVIDQAEDLGITFAFETQVTACDGDADEGYVVTGEGPDGERTFDAEAVLVAVGRAPVTDTINADALGLEPNEDGFFPTDERQETPVEGVYAVGDVAGDPMLAHVGMAEGVVASEAIAGEPAAFDHLAVPEVVFTDPEIATVGLSAEAAEEQGYTPNVGEFPFRASGRAMTLDRPEGLVRVVADAETDRLLGGAIVGPEASELIGEIGLGVELGATLEDMAKTIHAHPTLAEAIMEAAAHAHGEAIHRPN